MRYLLASVPIFILIVSTVIAWQLGIFSEGYPNLETPLLEQQKKPISPLNKQNSAEDKNNDEIKKQKQTVLQKEIEDRYTNQLLTIAQDYENQLNNLVYTAYEVNREGKSSRKSSLSLTS